jgi:hypothetical protein
MSTLTLDSPLCLSFSSALRHSPRPSLGSTESLSSQKPQVKSQRDLAKLKDRFSSTSDYYWLLAISYYLPAIPTSDHFTSPTAGRCQSDSLHVCVEQPSRNPWRSPTLPWNPFFDTQTEQNGSPPFIRFILYKNLPYSYSIDKLFGSRGASAQRSQPESSVSLSNR